MSTARRRYRPRRLRPTPYLALAAMRRTQTICSVPVGATLDHAATPMWSELEKRVDVFSSSSPAG